MAEKQMMVVVCDFPHKHDRAAVGQITIDVCSTHFKMFEAVGSAAICPDCSKTFKSTSGMRHHQTLVHGYEPATDRSRSKKKRRRTKAA